MNKNLAIVLIIILMGLQGVVLYLVSSQNLTTLSGERIAGITLGIDMFLFAGFIMIYHNNFSRTVFSKSESEEEDSESEE